MTFNVAADAYDRFVGRYSRELAPRFLAFAGVPEGPVLDVGCGPGSLTEAMAARFGATAVAAVDPSEPFVAGCRERVPGADVRLAAAEALPFDDGSFAAALTQLVLSFVRDARRAASEMARVVRAGGTVAACTFETNGFALARIFWDAALRFDSAAPDDARLPFRRMQTLVDLWEHTGLQRIETEILEIQVSYEDFDDFWSPFAFGVGPPGSYLVAQTDSRRAAIRDVCFATLGSPAGPFTLPAQVLAIRGRV